MLPTGLTGDGAPYDDVSASSSSPLVGGCRRLGGDGAAAGRRVEDGLRGCTRDAGLGTAGTMVTRLEGPPSTTGWEGCSRRDFPPFE